MEKRKEYKRIKYLVDYLNHQTYNYEIGEPSISDAVWDRLYFELKWLEEETGLIFNNSPTQTIFYDVVNELQKVEHNHKMLSLDKTKSVKEVIDFVGNNLFLTMCKMDGLTCSLTYREGKLVSAETRGNGIVGEDILHNANVIPSIPKSIPYTDELVIDGEIICTYKDFEDFKNEYKNPRNFASGSIRLLSASECGTRKLSFVAWDVISPMYFEDGIEYRLDQKLDFIDDFGFITVPRFIYNGSVISENIIDSLIYQIKEKAEENYYPIDGIVFKFADCAYGRNLGETSHHFKNAIAYKFLDETTTSHLLDIEWSMGRTGQITPIALFEPIEIDGSTVSRASLHNLSVMYDLLGTPYVGQEVEVSKRNMIIPQIESADKNNFSEENMIARPDKCPICGGMVAVRQDFDTQILECINLSCEGKLINKLVHFCGKNGLDIKGLSKATLEKLMDWGWVDSYTDIFELSVHQKEWVQKPGFGAKSVNNILNSIESSRNCELHQFICALGIPLIGSSASKELAKTFKDWNTFIETVYTNSNAIITIPNFGVVMYQSIMDFDFTEAKLLVEHYINFNQKQEESAVAGSDTLTGQTFVITGKVNKFKNRDELKELIESLGGKVVGSISKNTNYLINNDIESSSSKNVKAKQMNIPIISEENFLEIFEIKI